MGLNQRISLIFSAENKGDAAFNAVIHQLGSVSKGADTTSARLLAMARNSDALAASNERLALMSQKLGAFKIDTAAIASGAASYDKLTQAQQRLTLARAEGQKVLDGYSASAKAFAKVEADLAATQAKLVLAKSRLSDVDFSVNAAADPVTGIGRVSRARDVLDTARAQQTVAMQRIAKSPKMTQDERDAIAGAAADKVAAAEAKVTAELEAQRLIERQQVEAESRILDLYQQEVVLKGQLTGIGQLQIDQALEQERAQGRIMAAEISIRDTKTQQLAIEQGITAEQRRQDQLTAEQKALTAAPSKLPLLLTAGGTAAAVTAFVGYEASKTALGFQSTEAQLAAATNRPLSDITNIGNAALAFQKTGKSQFSASQVLQGTVRQLTVPLPADVIKAILPQEAQVAGIFKQTDLTSVATALNAEIGFLGKGKNTTAGDINRALQSFTATEQSTQADPGEVIKALPTLFSGLKGSGIQSNDALGLETGLVNATGISPQRIATWLGQLVKTSILNPNPNARKIAAQLPGLDGMFGQQGLAAFGNNPFAYLQNISDAVGTGPNRNQLIQQLLGGSLGGGGIVAARAFENITSGNTLQTAAGLSDKFANSQGSIGTGTTRLLEGEQQKLIGTGHKLEKQFIDLGTAINTIAIPAINDLALGISGAVDSVQAFGTGLDDWLKHHDPTGLIPKQVKDAASSAWNAIPGAAKVVAVVGGIPTLVIGATAAPGYIAGKAVYDKLTGTGAANAVGGFIGPIASGTANALGSTVNGVADLAQGKLSWNYFGANAKSFLTGMSANDFLTTPAPAKPVPVTIASIHPSAADQGQNLVPQRFILAADTQAEILARNTQIAANVLAGQNRTKNFNANLANFTGDIAGINAGTISMSTQDVQKFAHKLLAELKVPTVVANLGKAVANRDTMTIERDVQKLINIRNLDAANIKYNTAVTEQATIAGQTTNLAKNQAATENVYQQQLALIQAEKQAGTLKGKDIDTANQGALNAKNAGLLADITAPMNDAQARLQLAINNRSGIGAAAARVNQFTTMQAALPGGLTPAEAQLQTQATNLAAIQGPLADAQQALANAQSSGIGIGKARDAVVALLRKEAGPNVRGISLAALNAEIAQIDVTDLQKPLQDAQDAMTLAVQTGVGIGAAQAKLSSLLTTQARATHESAAALALQQAQLIGQGLQRPLAEAQAALTIAQNTGVGIGGAESNFLNLSAASAKAAGQTPGQIRVASDQTKAQDLQIALAQAQARLLRAQETGKGLVQANNDVATLMNEIAPLTGQGGAVLQNATDARNLQNLQGPLAKAQARLTLAQQNGTGIADATTKYFNLLAQEQAIPGGPSADQNELTRRSTIGQNLSIRESAAQANLSLAQGTGFGIDQAEKALAAVYKEEAKNHLISSEQLKLDLFQLHQTVANVLQPGPQLIRPTAPNDDLTVQFGGSRSRISTTAGPSSVLEKMLAVLEAQHQADERTIQWQGQEIKELRLGNGHLASIDAKTAPPPTKQKPAAGSNLPLSSYRVST